PDADREGPGVGHPDDVIPDDVIPVARCPGGPVARWPGVRVAFRFLSARAEVLSSVRADGFSGRSAGRSPGRPPGRTFGRRRDVSGRLRREISPVAVHTLLTMVHIRG